MSALEYTGIVFSFVDVVWECRILRDFAAGFLDPTTIYVLEQAASALEEIQSCPSGERYSWGISLESPLRTRVSKGEFQPDRLKGRNIHAEIASIWEIEPIAPKKNKPSTHFLLVGKASTTVRFFETLDDGQKKCSWVWNLDVGVGNSPGTHFHAQVKEWHEPGDVADFCCGSEMDIPRIPTLPFTPAMVVELVVAELFQDKWEIAKSEASGGTNDRWRGIQLGRLRSFLKWQSSILDALRAGSPLLALKMAKPPETVMGVSRP